MNRLQTIRMACRYFNYKWPEQLSSGVMFYFGERITIEEFNKQANLFKK